VGEGPEISNHATRDNDLLDEAPLATRAVLEQDVHDHRDWDLLLEHRLDEGPLGEGPHWRCRVFGLRPV